MERNKVEEHLKNVLKEREIRPSDKAWEHIVDQLDDKTPSKRHTFFWYGIAAGFVGIILVTALYFSMQKTDTGIDEILVDTPSQETESLRDREGNLQPVITKEDKPSSQSTAVLVEAKPEVNSSASRNLEKEQLQMLEPEKELGTASSHQSKEALLETKIAEVVAQVNLMEQDKNAVTDAEIDSLLRRAEREVLADKIFNSDEAVSASALLSEVEEELDQTFRDQIFEKLKTGFLKVRTAVADRNN